jgi:hypothetical protein
MRHCAGVAFDHDTPAKGRGVCGARGTCDSVGIAPGEYARLAGIEREEMIFSCSDPIGWCGAAIAVCAGTYGPFLHD